MACITTPYIFVILNGSPLKPVKMEKGLRQGDPLSPYLFILVSEALFFLLNKAENLQLTRPLQLGDHKINLKLLQFVDNTLLFLPLEEEVV